MKKFSIAMTIAVVAALLVITIALAGAFNNGNFELGDFTGWSKILTYENGGIVVGPPPSYIPDVGPGSGSDGIAGSWDATSIVNSTWMDTNFGAGVTCDPNADGNICLPFAGNDSAVVNYLGDLGNLNTLTQTGPALTLGDMGADGKYHIYFAYAPVLDKGSHAASDQPFMYVKLTRIRTGSSDKVMFEKFSYPDDGNPNWKWSTVTTSVAYMTWQTYDLAYSSADLSAGDELKLEVTAAGCKNTQGGHWGYIYVDEFGVTPPTGGTGPSISGMTPISGPVAGNTTVTITGSNFTTVNGLLVDGAAMTVGSSIGQYTIDSDTQITLHTPAHVVATVDVQVINPGGTAVYQFTYVATPPPDAFAKAAPADLSTNLPIATQLSWNTSTGADSYEYCLETDGNDACNGTWTSVGTATTASPTLLPGASYNWQVRAVNAGGTTEADSGAWWDFTTLAAPGTFGKTTPIDAAIVPVTTSLVWGTSTDAASYEYCLDADTNTICDSSWVSTALVTTASPTLTVGTTYSWQVHAINASGTTEANTGAWWTFTVQAAPTITEIFPNAGPVTGGTEVVVTGTNFMPAPNTIVTFDGLTATCTVDSATQLTCTTPAHAAGPVDVVVTTLGGPVTFANGFTYYEHWATFYSAGEYDGWVKQKAFGSKLGGLFNNKLNIPVGDDAQNRQIRSILSFNITTKLLPANAKIGAAFVRIKQLSASGIIGTNPFTIFGKLNVDIKKGYFGASKNLASDDYLAVATATRIGTFNQALSGTGWYTMNFSAKGMTAINRSGLTQLRLYFFKPTNKNNKADFFRYYPGDTRVPQASRPQLIIYYTLP